MNGNAKETITTTTVESLLNEKNVEHTNGFEHANGDNEEVKLNGEPTTQMLILDSAAD